MIFPLCVALTLAGAEKPKLAVLDLQPAGVAPEIATALTDAITQEVSRRGIFDVIASSDIRTLLGMERQKQLLGCSDDAKSCTAELAGALGARFVLSGTLSKLGDALQLSLQTLDTQKAQPIGRSVRIAADARELSEQLPWAVAEATGTPAPAPPSRALSVSLIGVGGAALVTGAIVGIDALSRESALRQDLAQPATTGTFKTFDTYQDSANQIGLQKTLALVSAIAGAALLAGGIVAWPRAMSGNATLLLTGNGLALVGVWP
jgi:TolB-like protein